METPKTAMHLHWLICMDFQGSIVENTLTTGKKHRAQGESESQQSKMELPWGCRDNGLSQECMWWNEGRTRYCVALDFHFCPLSTVGHITESLCLSFLICNYGFINVDISQNS